MKVHLRTDLSQQPPENFVGHNNPSVVEGVEIVK